MKKYLAIFVLVLVGIAGLAYAKTGDLTKTSTTVSAFKVTCATTATEIKPSSGLTSYTEVRCGVISTETDPVFIGSSAVDATDGYPVCAGTACVENALTISINLGYCLVSSGTADLYCIALN